jgi:hypothetical protein
MDAQGTPRLSTEDRKSLLERVLQHEISLGAHVENRMDVMAVVVAGQRRVTLAIDEHGQVLVDGKPAQPAPRAPSTHPSTGIPSPAEAPGAIEYEERKALLERVLQNEVSLGARVESQSDFTAVLVAGQRRVTLAIDERGQVLVDGHPARPGTPVPPPKSKAPAARAADTQGTSGGVVGLITRNQFAASVIGVILLAGVAAIAGRVANPPRAVERTAVQGRALQDIDAVSFLPLSAGLLNRTQIHKAPAGNAAWAKYSTTAHPGVEVEVQAQWEGPDFDDMVSAGGSPADIAGRRVYVSGPNVYDQLKIRWADRGWHFHVGVSYPGDVTRTAAEGIAQSVAADIITNGSRLTSALP